MNPLTQVRALERINERESLQQYAILTPSRPKFDPFRLETTDVIVEHTKARLTNPIKLRMKTSQEANSFGTSSSWSRLTPCPRFEMSLFRIR
jgi:hypothetical protein